MTFYKNYFQLKNKKFFTIMILVVLFIFSLGFYLYSLSRPSPLLSTFPSVTKTKSGHAGDPINVVFIGNKTELINVFIQAHWITSDPIDEASTIKIIKTTITYSPYPSAPVSKLYLFGRIQDLAFEYPTNIVRKRHHIRIWETGKLISGQHVWVGAVSFDSGIELSGTTHFPTHHIDPNVNAERNFLSQSLQITGLLKKLQLERITFPIIWGHNGGGDWYFNDGNAEVFILK